MFREVDMVGQGLYLVFPRVFFRILQNHHAVLHQVCKMHHVNRMTIAQLIRNLGMLGFFWDQSPGIAAHYGGLIIHLIKHKYM